MLNDFSHSNEPIVLTPVMLHLLPFIPYPDSQTGTGQLEMTAQFRKMYQGIGHTGAGKTRLLLEFARTHDTLITFAVTLFRITVDTKIIKFSCTFLPFERSLHHLYTQKTSVLFIDRYPIVTFKRITCRIPKSTKSFIP